MRHPLQDKYSINIPIFLKRFCAEYNSAHSDFTTSINEHKYYNYIIVYKNIGIHFSTDGLVWQWKANNRMYSPYNIFSMELLRYLQQLHVIKITSKLTKVLDN